MTITLPLDAVPQGRPRFVNGHAIDPSRSRAFKAKVALMILEQRRGLPLEGELAVTVRIYRKFKSIKNKHYGDIDNLVKGIFDGVTQSKVVWKDDIQVVELHAFKFLSQTPRIELEIEEVQQ